MNRIWSKWRWACALPLAAVLLLGACGGDDDDNKSSGSGSSVSSAGGTGSDEKYVADICGAFKTMSDALTKITADPKKLGNEKDAITAFSKPFDQLAKDFAKANPPKDLKDWHKEATKSLNGAADAIKKGDLSALQGLGNLPDPPKGADERLSKIAEKNKNCKESGIDFTK